jgi:glycosyltransferase involved in cell wall biosynthesis
VTSDSRVLIIIPALDEAESISKIIAEVRAEVPTVDILVVDDGSTDETAAVARAAGAIVASLPYNLGVGGAMRLGYRYAAEYGHDVAIQVDADGQHDPRYIPALIKALDSADFVIGARFAGAGDYRMRGPRKWASKILSLVLSRLAGTRLTDTTSGFRACNRRLIERFARFYPVEFLGDTIEVLVWAIRKGFVVRQVPVAMRMRTTGRATSPLKATVYLMRAIGTLMLAFVRR